jgi:hypothetical protein
LDLNSDWPSNYREQFAEAYPHNVGMAAALKMLDKTRKSGKAPWRVLLAGIASYVETKPADRHWMNPKTYLKQERWNDRPAPNGRHQSLAEYAAERARELEALERAGASGSTPDAIGGDEVGGDHAGLAHPSRSLTHRLHRLASHRHWMRQPRRKRNMVVPPGVT